MKNEDVTNSKYPLFFVFLLFPKAFITKNEEYKNEFDEMIKSFLANEGEQRTRFLNESTLNDLKIHGASYSDIECLSYDIQLKKINKNDDGLQIEETIQFKKQNYSKKEIFESNIRKLIFPVNFDRKDIFKCYKKTNNTITEDTIESMKSDHRYIGPISNKRLKNEFSIPFLLLFARNLFILTSDKLINPGRKKIEQDIAPSNSIIQYDNIIKMKLKEEIDRLYIYTDNTDLKKDYRSFLIEAFKYSIDFSRRDFFVKEKKKYIEIYLSFYKLINAYILFILEYWTQCYPNEALDWIEESSLKKLCLSTDDNYKVGHKKKIVVNILNVFLPDETVSEENCDDYIRNLLNIVIDYINELNNEEIPSKIKYMKKVLANNNSKIINQKIEEYDNSNTDVLKLKELDFLILEDILGEAF